MTAFVLTLLTVLGVGAVVGMAIVGLLDSLMGDLYTSALSDPRAGGSADGAPPAPNPPIGAGGAFQTPQEK